MLVDAADDPDTPGCARPPPWPGRLGIAEAGRDVLPPLTDDGDPAVRRRASVAAVRLGRDGPAATGAFARLLSDPDRRGGPPAHRPRTAGGPVPG
ncbi:hypothetical protein [Streptomyces tuirus]